MFHLAHKVATLLAFAYAHLSVSVSRVSPSLKTVTCESNVPHRREVISLSSFFLFSQSVADTLIPLYLLPTHIKTVLVGHYTAFLLIFAGDDGEKREKEHRR